jgi:CheY-like chemotaxis protein
MLKNALTFNAVQKVSEASLFPNPLLTYQWIFSSSFGDDESPPSLRTNQPKQGDGRKTLCVLIVEDNPDTATTLQDLLLFIGYEVRVARNGLEGLEIARNFLPHVILCDIGLPELNGYKVAQSIRAEPRTAAATLIAITGYGSERDRSQAKAAGFDHHLVKPVDLNLLEELLAFEQTRRAGD